MGAIDYSFLQNPQQRAVSYNNTPEVDRTDYVNALATGAQDMAINREQSRREKRALDIAENSARNELMLNTASTGAQLSMLEPVRENVTYPLARKAIGLVKPKGMPVPQSNPTLSYTSNAGAATTARGVPSGAGKTITIGANQGSGAAKVASAASKTGDTAKALDIGKGAAKSGSKIGGYAKDIGPHAAGTLAGGITSKYMRDKGASKQRAANVGAATNMGANIAAYSILNMAAPGVGALAGMGATAALGWIHDTNDKCIIVTACTDPNSQEVEITRAYRDKYMTKDEIRGYYMLADRIVPTLRKNKMLRTLTKKNLVDPLVEYGVHKLYHAYCRKKSERIAKAFLGTCWFLGKLRSSYTRSTGEVY